MIAIRLNMRLEPEKPYCMIVTTVRAHRVLKREYPQLQLYVHRTIWSEYFDLREGPGFTITEKCTGRVVGDGDSVREAVAEAVKVIRYHGVTGCKAQIKRRIREHQRAKDGALT